MSWSLRIGRFFGIDVFLHFTFLIMLVWIVGEAYVRTRDWRIALDSFVFWVLLFRPSQIIPLMVVTLGPGLNSRPSSL